MQWPSEVSFFALLAAASSAAFLLWRVRNAGVMALLVLGAALGLAWPTANHLTSAPGSGAAPLAHLGQRAATDASAGLSFAIADFDGDRQPDLATAEIAHSDSHSTLYLIRLHFGDAGNSRQSIDVNGSFGLPQISARDVNGDNVPDLVVTAAGQLRPIAILLNDGRGRFSLASPSDFPAAASESPRRWGSSGHQIRDASILLPARTLPAGASNACESFVPRKTAHPSMARDFVLALEPLPASALGRAPPALA